jgi:hypothetical protein
MIGEEIIPHLRDLPSGEEEVQAINECRVMRG